MVTTTYKMYSHTKMNTCWAQILMMKEHVILYYIPLNKIPQINKHIIHINVFHNWQACEPSSNIDAYKTSASVHKDDFTHSFTVHIRNHSFAVTRLMGLNTPRETNHQLGG